MSIVGRVGTAAGAKMLTMTTTTTTGARPTTRGRTSPTTKRTLVVAVALLALLAFAALIPASEAKDAEHSYVAARSSTPDRSGAPQMRKKGALDAYEKLPLSFIPNEGQTDKAVRYYAQGAGYGFFFTKRGAMLSFAEGKGRGHALALDFQGADPHATLTARKRLAGKVNYLVGDDPSKWQQGLPTHAELLYGGLWPGIDMAVRGEGGDLKYEFRLKPGSSVEDVRLGYRGAEGIKVGAGGELLVQTPLGVLKDAAPESYQLIGGERVPVQSRYVLKGDGSGYGFAVGAHDPHYPLIIDPGLDYSTFLGGMDFDEGSGIAVDRRGKAYVTGDTFSTDYPTTPGAFDRTLDGSSDAFVTKLNAAGSALVYSTFLGGTDLEGGNGIAVRDGKAYVTGTTLSPDYPTTSGAFDRTLDGSGDAFVTKLNAAGSALAYSTFLGGTSNDEGVGIGVNRTGRAYVTGRTFSPNYPTTPSAFDASFNGGNTDTFVTKLNASGSALAYSTFLGGTDPDEGVGIAVRDGKAYVTGRTNSTNYPTTPSAFDTSFNGGNTDTFVTKLNASGSALAYSTFLGGTSGDFGSDIAVDRRGRGYVTGTTDSADYPTTRGAFDRTLDGSSDAFVTKLNASGSALAYSTFLGGTGGDFGRGIAVDRRGKAYVTGVTGSADYPTTRGAFDRTYNGSGDAFVTKLNAAGSALVYSTFLGGSDLDRGDSIAVRFGRAYVTGQTPSADYPTTPDAFDTNFNGGPVDAFVTKLPTG